MEEDKSNAKRPPKQPVTRKGKGRRADVDPTAREGSEMPRAQKRGKKEKDNSEAADSISIPAALSDVKPGGGDLFDILNPRERLLFLNETLSLPPVINNIIREYVRMPLQGELVQSLTVNEKDDLHLMCQCKDRLVAACLVTRRMHVLSYAGEQFHMDRTERLPEIAFALCHMGSGVVAVALDDGNVQFYDTCSEGQEHLVGTLATNYRYMASALLPLRSGRLMTGHSDGTLKEWLCEDSEVEKQRQEERERKILARSKNKNTSTPDLASEDQASATEPYAYAWQGNKKCCRTIAAHSAKVNTLLELSNGIIASAANDCTIKLWPPNSLECIRTLTGDASTRRVTHLAEVASSYVCACGSSHDYDSKEPSKHITLVSASQDNKMRVWCVSSGQCLRVIDMLRMRLGLIIQMVYDASIGLVTYHCTKNGSTASTSVHVWNEETGECLRRFDSTTAHITALLLWKSTVQGQQEDEQVDSASTPNLQSSKSPLEPSPTASRPESTSLLVAGGFWAGKTMKARIEEWK